MDIANQIQALIEEAGKESIFTKGIIEEVNKTLKQNEEFQKTIDKFAEEIENKRLQVIEYGELIANLNCQISGYQEREDDLAKRELNILKLELEAANAALRVQDHKDMVGLIFRNAKLMENRFGSVPVSDGQGFVSAQPHNEQTETETK